MNTESFQIFTVPQPCLPVTLSTSNSAVLTFIDVPLRTLSKEFTSVFIIIITPFTPGFYWFTSFLFSCVRIIMNRIDINRFGNNTMPLRRHRTQGVGSNESFRSPEELCPRRPVVRKHTDRFAVGLLRRALRMPVCSGYYYWVTKTPKLSSLKQLCHDAHGPSRL